MPLDFTLVLDTNTVLALWMFRDPGLTALADHIAQGRCRLYTRPDALDELTRVLAYRQFAVPQATQQAILAHYQTIIEPLTAPAPDPLPLPICRDRDDQKFLEIAGDCAPCTLLTRDKALLRLARHRWVRDRFAILTPERWQAEQAEAPTGP